MKSDDMLTDKSNPNENIENIEEIKLKNKEKVENIKDRSNKDNKVSIEKSIEKTKVIEEAQDSPLHLNEPKNESMGIKVDIGDDDDDDDDDKVLDDEDN